MAIHMRLPCLRFFFPFVSELDASACVCVCVCARARYRPVFHSREQLPIQGNRERIVCVRDKLRVEIIYQIICVLNAAQISAGICGDTFTIRAHRQ